MSEQPSARLWPHRPPCLKNHVPPPAGIINPRGSHCPAPGLRVPICEVRWATPDAVPASVTFTSSSYAANWFQGSCYKPVWTECGPRLACAHRLAQGNGDSHSLGDTVDGRASAEQPPVLLWCSRVPQAQLTAMAAGSVDALLHPCPSLSKLPGGPPGSSSWAGSSVRNSQISHGITPRALTQRVPWPY